MNTVRWLALALSRFEEPRPERAPADAEIVLTDAFISDFSGESLVRDIAREVRVFTQGAVILRELNAEDFPDDVIGRGPEAYLELVSRRLSVGRPTQRRLILSPTEIPVRFVDPAESGPG
jgi:hypothetical protein